MTDCDDKNCPFHGELKISKRTFSGTVGSARMKRTVNVKRELRVFLPKYERFAKRHYSLKAHNPDCIGAKEGNEVIVAECKPLSKSKHFVVIKKKEEAK
jgi:small subunit ribosomal protein S17